MFLSPLSAVLLDELLFFVMLCQCSVTVIMFLQQCVAINVFVTMFLYIICNHNACDRLLDQEPRTVIHVKRAKRFDPMG